jgi:hypothetical protein
MKRFAWRLWKRTMMAFGFRGLAWIPWDASRRYIVYYTLNVLRVYECQEGDYPWRGWWVWPWQHSHSRKWPAGDRRACREAYVLWLRQGAMRRGIAPTLTSVYPLTNGRTATHDGVALG